MCTSERIRSLGLFYRKFKYICESIFKYLYLAKKDRVSFFKARTRLICLAQFLPRFLFLNLLTVFTFAH